MKNKKAISPLIATVMIIIISLAAVGIVWQVVIPLIKTSTETTEKCQSTFLEVSSKSFYNVSSGQASILISRGAPVMGTEAVELAAIQIKVTSDTGDSKTVTINASQTALPKINEDKLYVINLGGLTGSSFKVEVAPVVEVNEKERLCSMTKEHTLNYVGTPQTCLYICCAGNEVCIGTDQGTTSDCSTECCDGTCCIDSDDDGHGDELCGGDDCDDTNPSINPGAAEICGNGIDEDCSGADLPCAGTGNVYYVDKQNISGSCSDSNNGSETEPWCTIQKAAGTMVAGDTVYVKNGIYYENVVLQNSGSTVNITTYKAYPGHKAVIDGGGSGTVFDITGKSYIWVEGLEIKNAGMWGILIQDSTNIELKNVNVSYSTYENIQVRGSSSYIIIEDCEASYSSSWSGIDIYQYNGRPHHVTVRNCIAHHNGGFAGIASEQADNLIIDSNICYSNSLGIDIGSGDSNVIKNNIVYDCDTGIALSSNEDSEVYDNTIYNIVDEAIYSYYFVDHGEAHARNKWYRNIIYNSGFGIYESKKTAASTNHEFYNNLFYNIGTHGAYRTSFYFDGSTSIKFYSNTIYMNADYDALEFANGAINSQIKNNIISISGSKSTIIMDASSSSGAVVDYNNYHNRAGTATGPGANSIVADPKFVNPANSDFHLQPGSPCIDAGTSDNAPTTDIEGNIRYDDPATPNTGGGTYPYYDIGSYEYQGGALQTCSQKGGTCCGTGETCVGNDLGATSDCLTICCDGTCSAGAGNVYYVDNSGACDDTNPGTEAAPWCTIGKAATTMVAGDTVYVKAGTYSGFSIPTSGTAGRYITYSAYPGDTVITGEIWFANAASYIKVNGFNPSKINMITANSYNIISNNKVISNNDPGGCMNFEGVGHIIEGNEFCCSGAHGLHHGNEGINTIIRNNSFHDNALHGWGAVGGKNESVINNTFYNNGRVGLFYCTASPANITIEGNLAFNNNREGTDSYYSEICVKGPGAIVRGNTAYTPATSISTYTYNLIEASGVVVKNNIGYRTGVGKVVVQVYTDAIVDYNDWFNPNEPAIIRRGWDTPITLATYKTYGQCANCISQDPSFVNLAGNDFRLQSTSPCCGTGEGGSNMGALPCV